MMRCDHCDYQLHDLASFVAHNFRHVYEEMRKMTDQIQALTDADNAEGAAELRLAAAVGALAVQQKTFLADIKTALAGLGNNDQVTAIVNDITSRQAQLQALADQATQMAQDQAAADPETASTSTETPDPATAVGE